MDEVKVQIGEEVLLDIGIHSEWYISSVGYDGESVDVALRRKADRNKEWWLADTPQTDLLAKTPRKSLESHEIDTPQTERMTEEEIDTMLAKALVGQTDCPWK